MARLDFRQEVNYFERDPPANCDAEGCGGYYSRDERIERHLLEYLEKNAVKIRKLDFDAFGLDIHTSLWRINDAVIKVRHWGEDIDDDWPFMYPQKEIMEVQLSGKFDRSLVNMLNEYCLTEINSKQSTSPSIK